ncbi:lysophospholipase [Paenibacillus sp. y28]|uniref:lysophospholipase n=1 Tax=Paenibacillus sp. y28 TaxID=3129110 RepID=UPI003017C4E5
MRKLEWLELEDGKRAAVHVWLPGPQQSVHAAVHICHGMAEHAGRYERLAVELVSHGCAVAAQDHRGHGQTAGSLDQRGVLPSRGGWEQLVRDAQAAAVWTAGLAPGKPLFLLGHSMGSFLARRVAQVGLPQPGLRLSGLIASGTAGNPGPMAAIGRLLARSAASLHRPDTPSPLMDRLIFGGYNRRFRPVRTSYDWLSRDTQEVGRYLADPWCGGIFPARFYAELLYGIRQVNRPAELRRTPPELPVLLLSGSEDPLARLGRGIAAVQRAYAGAGAADVQLKLYPGGRHEPLNEVNRDEVVRDILVWLEQHGLPRSECYH